MKCSVCGNDTSNYDSKKRRAICPACDAKQKGKVCNKCGDCCRGFHMPLKNLNNDVRKYLLYHENCEIQEHNGKHFLYIKNKCKHLGDDNLCAIYESRPEVCKRGYTEDTDNVIYPEKCSLKPDG